MRRLGKWKNRDYVLLTFGQIRFVNVVIDGRKGVKWISR